MKAVDAMDAWEGVEGVDAVNAMTPAGRREGVLPDRQGGCV